MKNFITKYFLNSPRKVFLTGLVYSAVLFVLTFALIADYAADQEVNVYWVMAGFGVYFLTVFQKYLSDNSETHYKEKYIGLLKDTLAVKTDYADLVKENCELKQWRDEVKPFIKKDNFIREIPEVPDAHFEPHIDEVLDNANKLRIAEYLEGKKGTTDGL